MYISLHYAFNYQVFIQYQLIISTKQTKFTTKKRMAGLKNFPNKIYINMLDMHYILPGLSHEFSPITTNNLTQA